MKSYMALVMSLMLAGASLAYAAEDTDKAMDSDSDKKMQPDSKAPPKNKAATEQKEMKKMKGSLGDMNPDDLEGMDIYDSSNTQIGDVDEIVVDKSGTRMVVIGLEDDTKEVVVPLDKFKMSSDKESLTLDMSMKQLMKLPDYDPMDMKSAEE